MAPTQWAASPMGKGGRRCQGRLRAECRYVAGWAGRGGAPRGGLRRAAGAHSVAAALAAAAAFMS